MTDPVKTAEWEYLDRPSSPALDAVLGVPTPLLDHGFIRPIDYMGNEAAILQAARVSYGKGTKTPSDDKSLLRYLMRHSHTTPFEMCEIKLHMKLPVFVARQLIRHRTANVNEYSARYSIMAREFHVPDAADLAPQSKTNRQGRAGSYSPSDAAILRMILKQTANDSFDAYEAMIAESYDLARETAREVLPLSTYTEWYWKIDLHNLLHFLKLRMDPHAQKEIRVYANAISDLVKVWVPNVWTAFEDYVLGAHTFSRQEMEIISDIISGHGFTGRHMEIIQNALSSRERASFFECLGVEEGEG